MTKPEGRITFHLTKFIDNKNHRFTESQMVGQKCKELCARLVYYQALTYTAVMQDGVCLCARGII